MCFPAVVAVGSTRSWVGTVQQHHAENGFCIGHQRCRSMTTHASHGLSKAIEADHDISQQHRLIILVDADSFTSGAVEPPVDLGGQNSQHLLQRPASDRPSRCTIVSCWRHQMLEQGAEGRIEPAAGCRLRAAAAAAPPSAPQVTRMTRRCHLLPMVHRLPPSAAPQPPARDRS